MIRPSTTLLLALTILACRNEPPTTDPSTPAPGPSVVEDQSQLDADAAATEPETAATPTPPAGPPPVPEADKSFAMEAAKAGMAEVELSKVALAGAKKPAIKELAQMMIDDHTKANEELTTLAGGRGLELPKEPDQATIDRKAGLEKLKGTKLEKAYLDHMLADHRKAVDLFRTQSTSGTDPELKDWAAQTLPKLEEHLSHTEAVASGKPHAAKQAAAPAKTQ